MRSSTVIARVAATVSSSGPSGRFSTRMSANSGAQRVIGSSRAIRPCSTSLSAAATATGLDMEAIGKMASGVIGRPVATSATPAACRSRMRPPCQTSVTTPGTSPPWTAASAMARTLSMASATAQAPAGGEVNWMPRSRAIRRTIGGNSSMPETVSSATSARGEMLVQTAQAFSP